MVALQADSLFERDTDRQTIIYYYMGFVLKLNIIKKHGIPTSDAPTHSYDKHKP